MKSVLTNRLYKRKSQSNTAEQPEQEVNSRRSPGRPRLGDRRAATLTLGQARRLSAVLGQAAENPSEVLKKDFAHWAALLAEIVQTLEAKPVARRKGRTASQYRVQCADGAVHLVTGGAAAAELVGRTLGTLRVRMSYGNGVARFPTRDANGNPAEMVVEKLA